MLDYWLLLFCVGQGAREGCTCLSESSESKKPSLKKKCTDSQNFVDNSRGYMDSLIKGR